VSRMEIQTWLVCMQLNSQQSIFTWNFFFSFINWIFISHFSTTNCLFVTWFFPLMLLIIYLFDFNRVFILLWQESTFVITGILSGINYCNCFLFGLKWSGNKIQVSRNSQKYYQILYFSIRSQNCIEQ
jgi:hypothetical protein